MENEKNELNLKNEISPRKKDRFFCIIITETVYIAVILAAVLIIKYFFGGTYGEIKKQYREKLLTETEISEVLNSGDCDEV